MDAKETQEYTNRIKQIVLGLIGSGATGTAVLATTGGLKSATIKTAGTNYEVNDVLTVADGTGGTFTVTEVDVNGEVTAITLTTPGSGYANVDGAAVTSSPVHDPEASGCTLVTVCEFAVDSVTIGGSGGSNYVSATAEFSGGGGGTAANGTVTIGSGDDAGKITEITAPVGKKYTSVPTITIAAGVPADGDRVIDSLKEYDLAQQNARLKAALEDSVVVNVIDYVAAGKITDAIAALS